MEKKKEINWKIIFILLSVAFISPSVVYLLQGRKIIDLVSSFTFFFTHSTWGITPGKVIGTIFFVGIFVALAFVYYKIIKNYKREFTSGKKVAIFVTIVSLLFFIMLPLTSTDVFYYIGTGWSEAHYKVNPYYTSVNEVMAESEEAANDDMLLKMKGIWSGQTIVYGPAWPLICKILSGLSMGNLFLALFIYKLFNLGLHLINTYLIYKITNKRNIFALLYGINPLILFDGLANVHNELVLIFLILLGLYFFIKKKNLALTVISFALASAVKYVAILLIPFIILYHYRKENLFKKILYSFLWAILFIVVLALCYSVYMRDFDFLNGIMTQQGKFVNSIFTPLVLKDFNLGLAVSKGCMLAFIVIYLINIIKLLFTKKQYIFSTYIRKYNGLLVLFLFGVITNFQSWYTLWLLPTMLWEDSKNIKWLASITILAELSNTIYFVAYEHYMFGAIYPIILLVAMVISKVLCERKQKDKQLYIKERRDGIKK